MYEEDSVEHYANAQAGGAEHFSCHVRWSGCRYSEHIALSTAAASRYNTLY